MGEQDDLEWRPRAGCRDTPRELDKTTWPVTFSAGRRLTVAQRPAAGDEDGPRRGRVPIVSGRLRVVGSSGESSTGGSVEVEVLSNDERLMAETRVDGSQVVTITTPRLVDWWDDDAAAPCVQVRVTVYVPHGGRIDALDLKVTHLDVEITQGLVLSVVTAEGVYIRTLTGSVEAPPRPAGSLPPPPPYALQARRIAISTQAGHIRGWFPLYDFLAADSSAGDISLDVGLMPADARSAPQAVLSAGSISGDVTLREPIAEGTPPPFRDYVVSAGSVSGDIRARVAATSRADFHSTSGDLNVTLLPLPAAGLNHLTFITATKSGATAVTVAASALSDLQSTHTSVASDLRLFYPDSWTGSFTASSLSGAVTARGKDLTITRASRRGFPAMVEGHKGEGASSARIASVSGRVALLVGDK